MRLVLEGRGVLTTEAMAGIPAENDCCLVHERRRLF